MENNSQLTLGKLIQNVRREKCVGLRTLSSMSGLSVERISAIENSQEPEPSYRELRILEQVLGLPQEVLCKLKELGPEGMRQLELSRTRAQAEVFWNSILIGVIH